MSLAQCWTPAARLLLIVVAVPLAVRCVGAGLGRAASPPPSWPDLVVDPNTAPSAVLEALPGLGPALTERIVAARRERPFDSLADLDQRVRGIGPAKMGLLRSFLRVDPR